MGTIEVNSSVVAAIANLSVYTGSSTAENAVTAIEVFSSQTNTAKARKEAYENAAETIGTRT